MNWNVQIEYISSSGDQAEIPISVFAVSRDHALIAAGQEISKIDIDIVTIVAVSVHRA